MGNVLCCVGPPPNETYLANEKVAVESSKTVVEEEVAAIGRDSNSNKDKPKCAIDSKEVPTDMILNMIDHENGPAKGLAYEVHWLGPPLPPCEQARAATMQAIGKIGGHEDPEINSILKLTASIFKAPVALVALFDTKRVFVCDQQGDIIDRGDFPWRWTLCAWSLAYNNPQILVIPDTSQDARFHDNQKVKGFPFVRFYCGSPLVASNGHRLGTLCFADGAPRPAFDAGSCIIMNNLAELVVRHLEKDIALQLKEKGNKKLQSVYSTLQRTFDCLDHCVALLDTHADGWKVIHTNAAWSKVLGLDRDSLMGMSLSEMFSAADGSFLPHPALKQAVQELSHFSVLGAKMKLLATNHPSQVNLTFRPGCRGGFDEDTVPIGIPSFLSHDTPEESRYYFMLVELPSAKSRKSSVTSFLTSSFGSRSTAPFEGLNLCHLLGKGAFGSVYYGNWKGTPVAVKVVEQDSYTVVDVDGVPLEAVISQQLRHPNIVTCLGYLNKWNAKEACQSQASNAFSIDTNQQIMTEDTAYCTSAVDKTPRQAIMDTCNDSEIHFSEDKNLNFASGTLPCWPVLNLNDPSMEKAPDDHADSATNSAAMNTTRGKSTVPSPSQTWILLEYCDRGCLQEAIDRGWLLDERSVLVGQPNLPAIVATAREIACGLAYLHGHKIVHRDLNSWNVMLCTAGVGADKGKRGFIAKVADFGLSRSMDVRSRITTKTYGTISHMPPETLKDNIVSLATDVYSFGVLLWQMYTSSRPYSGLTHGQIIVSVVVEKRQLQFPKTVPPEYRTLAYACMDPDPEKRPTMDAVVSMLDELLNGTF